MHRDSSRHPNSIEKGNETHPVKAEQLNATLDNEGVFTAGEAKYLLLMHVLNSLNSCILGFARA